ncbi:MAG: DUF4954 family protein [Candidatus Sumerlaeia bacterium]|nr:DUF4954 family protein [Candidatus Sumerlaeia bacterium]
MAIQLSDIEQRSQYGEFLTTVSKWIGFPAAAPAGLRGDFHPATPAQVAQLERQGCVSSDWGRIHFCSNSDLANFWRSRFEGRCYFEAHPSDGASRSLTVENCRVRDSVILSGCRIQDVSQIHATIIFKETEILHGGALGGIDHHSFGLDREIAFAPGGGRRSLPVFADASIAELAAMARLAPEDPLLAQYRDFVAKLVRNMRCTLTFIGSGGMLRNFGTITRSYLGRAVKVEGAPLVSECILLSSARRPTQLLVPGPLTRAVAQEGCEFSNGGRADNVFLAEGSHVRDHASATSSIIASNTGVGGGELRHSFLGPLTGFSHQALCIATFWPGGRGNVSYGANVGSNHSGRAADQEHFAGEGVFYGLGCDIKFPFNTMDAPYTIFATGVVCQPQKFDFPFSLVNIPEHSGPAVPRGLNEAFPGWQVRNNLYGLLRNQEKFQTRNSAEREVVETRVFRKEFRAGAERALAALRGAAKQDAAGVLPSGERWFTEDQVPGLGKNYVREPQVRAGILHYEFLLRLIAYFELAGSGKAAQGLDVVKDVVKTLEENRRKDFDRGRRVIPDYEEIHGTIAQDSLIQAWKERLEGD